MRIPAFAAPVIGALTGILYPPQCLLCSIRLDSGRDALCGACGRSFRRVDRSDPLLREGLARLTADGTADAFFAAYLFEKTGTLQSAIHLLKYAGMHSLGVWLGRELGAAMLAEPEYSGADLLVPVPLHPARLRERGYNQAERICAGVAAVTGIAPARGALARARNTPSQTGLGHHEREENVRGAFVAAGRDGASLRGRRVVLVDDVMTTGSTVLACARSLRVAGVRSVLVATVAVADRAG